MTAQQRVKRLLYLCKAVRAASRNQNDETREGFTKVPVVIFLLFKLTLKLQENSPIFLFFFFFFTNLDLNNHQISSDCFFGVDPDLIEMLCHDLKQPLMLKTPSLELN